MQKRNRVITWHRALPVLLLLIASCATSPLGRRQLSLVSDDELSQMGLQAFDKMKQEQPIETSAAINAYVNCVAAPLVREVGGGSWEVVVFRDDEPNAFALPGGKIGVHTGLLKVAVTADQLAAVVGHELAHVLSHHSNERMSQQLAVDQGVSLAQGVFKLDANSTWMAALGLGAQVGLLLPYSRIQESEADLLGLDLMAKAGFDPRQSINLWQNMDKAGGAATLPFLSTHPTNVNRISELENRMSMALGLYQQAQASGKRPQCRPVSP